MIAWYNILSIAVIFIGTLWIIVRIYLPLQQLCSMAKRVNAGKKVQAWEVNGPGVIQQLARELADLSSEFERLRRTDESRALELDTVLSHIEEGVVLVDPQGVIKLSNPSFAHLFGIERSPDGERLRDQIQIFEVNDVVQHVLKSGEEQGDFISYQSINEGIMTERSFRLTGIPMLDKDQSLSGCLLVVTDFSKLKQMESVERQMVSSVSHELRTPLAVFKGYLEALIEHEKEGDAETRRILQVLSRHSNRLNQLVEDLLILGRIEEQGLSPIIEPVDVSELLERVKEDSRHFLSTETELELVVEEGLHTVYLDPFRMEQVFHNLIDNVHRHSENSKTIRIGVKVDAKSKRVLFYVRDYGIGIASDKLPLIFNRFYRVDRARSRARGGTGLGLTIVREIVRAHGGEAWAESELGEGSTFWVSLPARPQEPDQGV